MTVSANISNLVLNVGHPSGTQALITKIGDLKINDAVRFPNKIEINHNRYKVGVLEKG